MLGLGKISPPIKFSSPWCHNHNITMKTPWHGSTFSMHSWKFCDGNNPTTNGLPLQRISKAELWCFLYWCGNEQAFEKIVESPVIWDAMTLIRRHYNGKLKCRLLRCRHFDWLIAISFYDSRPINTNQVRPLDPVTLMGSCHSQTKGTRSASDPKKIMHTFHDFTVLLCLLPVDSPRDHFVYAPSQWEATL